MRKTKYKPRAKEAKSSVLSIRVTPSYKKKLIAELNKRNAIVSFLVVTLLDDWLRKNTDTEKTSGERD